MRVVIAPSFGPVFHDDCFDFGLLPVELDERVVATLADRVRADPAIRVTVDLASERVERPGMPPVPFSIDPRRRSSLLEGRDTTLLERLRHGASADAMRERDRRRRPWIYDARDRRNP